MPGNFDRETIRECRVVVPRPSCRMDLCPVRPFIGASKSVDAGDQRIPPKLSRFRKDRA